MEIDTESQAELVREKIKEALDEVLNDKSYKVSDNYKHLTVQLVFGFYRQGFNDGIDASLSTLKEIKEIMR